jgi:hypothetical protein
VQGPGLGIRVPSRLNIALRDIVLPKDGLILPAGGQSPVQLPLPEHETAAGQRAPIHVRGAGIFCGEA